MSSTSLNTSEIARCFDGFACRFAKRLQRKGLSRTARLLAAHLAVHDLRGRTVLELGCGVGGLTLELVRQGAPSVVGLDLSPRMIELARERARLEGLENRVHFEIGDGAATPLPSSDVVILDAVFCCYPDAPSLAQQSLRACRSLYCFSVPRDRGIWGVLWRLAMPVVHLYARLRGCGARAYLHSVATLEEIARDHGFTATLRRVTRMWVVAVFERPATSRLPNP